MNYCLAIDIAKGKSAVGLFVNEFSSPLIEPYYFKHTLEELGSLYSKLVKYGKENGFKNRQRSRRYIGGYFKRTWRQRKYLHLFQGQNI